ncbi:MAG: NAD(+) synthase [Treponema sp.]|uniref:NAD(+) synthase n=1 Tax=Treponema sp. TaxID=166 RepID=UPI0025E34454|nr:NAD(+) synthase [Treponema sp.]MBQ9281183.1 NAD(+) synthase [Treponema sp.]
MDAYAFDAEKIAAEVISWIQKWVSENGNEQTKVVVGVSGGKDSSVVSALLVKALGKDRVIGVMMPNGEQKDISDSQTLVSYLGIKHFTVNIAKAYEGIQKSFADAGVIVKKENVTEKQTNDSLLDSFSAVFKTNTPARLRMVTLYGIGAQIGNCRVVNTCNLSEDLVGYSTFYGDAAGDFAPINKLTTEEVVAIGDYLGLPSSLTHKAPSDGMCGKTDEDNLGFTYHEVNEIARKNEKGPNYDKIIAKYKANLFKVKIIALPCYKPNLPLFLDI